MATERQIATNRRNSRNSTGPRSSAAKKRTSRNAYRHGLTLSLTSSAVFAKRLDKLARKIAGNSKDEIILQHAGAAAQAALDLARVRQVKIALIECVSVLGALDAPQLFGSIMKRLRYYELVLAGKPPYVIPEPIAPLSTMPAEEPERTAEAIRRALPELHKLDRYERRAVARRDRAISQIIESKAK